MAWEPNDLDLRANYDLGVEAGKALREQEIIKLLENYIPDPHEPNEACQDCEQVRDLIALIKGEQKEYPLPLPAKTAENTEPAPLSRPMKFKGEQ